MFELISLWMVRCDLVLVSNPAKDLSYCAKYGFTKNDMK